MKKFVHRDGFGDHTVYVAVKKDKTVWVKEPKKRALTKVSSLTYDMVMIGVKLGQYIPYICPKK